MESNAKYDTKYIVYVKGLPWTASKIDIVGFFSNHMRIRNGINGIHFVVNNVCNNEAYIQLTSKNDYLWAIERKVMFMGNSSVKCKFFLLSKQFC